MDEEDDTEFEDAFYNNYLIIDVDNYNRPLKNYPQTLNKIEEVDETPSPDENGNIRRVAWNPHREVIPISNRKQRPKSANYARYDGQREVQDVRPKSSCAGYPSRIPVKTNQNKCQHYSDFLEPYRPKSACSLRTANERGLIARRTSSQPNIARTKNVWTEVNQYRRSLQLLGLSHSDFGLPESPKREQQTSRTPSVHGPTFTTRIIKRSFSLDSLKEAVRHEDCPRQLLAQAAYEEWYFKKTEEIAQKLKAEKEEQEKVKKKLEIDRETRREKSAEHLMKWMESKQQKKTKKPKMNQTVGLMKSKEEIDKAYLDWKKKKQVGRKTVQNDENDREKAEKEEKRKHAEKAFKEWKTKLLESQRLQKVKEQEAQERMRRKLTEQTKPRTSFQAWKQHKDDEIRSKTKQARDAAKQVEDTRSMIITERMYEAEQAFEDWLEKVDHRRIKTKSRSKTGHD